ncbi:hypothetical protein B0H34DRAFT_675345 [Crassisporium funariophilum]|nr:hypothetical protein B0H34DRAFT_675345 [Crassisporium funariophilum]
MSDAGESCGLPIATISSFIDIIQSFASSPSSGVDAASGCFVTIAEQTTKSRIEVHDAAEMNKPLKHYKTESVEPAEPALPSPDSSRKPITPSLSLLGRELHLHLSRLLLLTGSTPPHSGNPFQADANIDRVYLIAPPVTDALTYVKPFIDLAVDKGVKRFVLLSATTTEPGSFGSGFNHQYLLDIGVDYAVLRPTWFMLSSTKTKSSQQPKMAASHTTEDIAQAAFDALTSGKSPNRDYLIVGPELFSYDDGFKSSAYQTLGQKVAKLLTDVLGREITHKKISVDEAIKIYLKFGMPQPLAEGLATLESLVAGGSEEKAFYADKDRKIVGKHTLRGYLEANRHIWAKA